MVAIAVDRYLSICLPLVSALTAVRAWMVTAVLALFAAAIGLCVALMYSVRHFIPLVVDDDADRKQFSSSQPTPTDTVSITGAGPEHCFDGPTTSPSTMVEVDRGVCYPTDEIFSTDFMWYFQKVYNGLFLVCFVTVVVLYVLIYQSVLQRRSRHQRQKSRSLSLMATHSQRHRSSARSARNSSFVTIVDQAETTELHRLARGTAMVAASTTADDALLQALHERKLNRVANLKTAAMLFVVTVVFVVTFLPAFLMTVHLIPYSRIVFYMYFANNVANPIIYSFMNRNFRTHLKNTICRRRRNVSN